MQTDEPTGVGEGNSRPRFSLRPPRRWQRLTLGWALVLGGVVGFLPILGFWMLPLGVYMLSEDLAFMRRTRRRFEVWWGRRRAGGRTRLDEANPAP